MTGEFLIEKGQEEKQFCCKKEGVQRGWIWDWDATGIPWRDVHTSGLREKVEAPVRPTPQEIV